MWSNSMSNKLAGLLAIAAVAIGFSAAAQEIARTADGHPDLSGRWANTTRLSPLALQIESADGERLSRIDQQARFVPPEQVPGVLEWTEAPTYKPEHQARVDELYATANRSDPVVYCEKPGLPRVGPPRRIVQLPDEVIFFYEEMAGDVYRIIPTDGRPHDEFANPAPYGDSVGHWEGDVLVVEVNSFDDSTWFGERGYFHTDAMTVTERLFLDGERLIYQVTVDDPNVLIEPWTMAPRAVTPDGLPLQESAPCIEEDAQYFINDDHHIQR
jgi:hypothetical protein